MTGGVSGLCLSAVSPLLIWSHPKFDTYMLAAAPGGSELAIVGSAGPSSFLYLLGPDRAVTAIREVRSGWDIWTPIFVHAPTDPGGPLRLYWVEHSDSLFDVGTATPLMRVMEYDGSSVHQVAVPLLWGEAPYAMDAYPGDTTSTLETFRTENIPTRHQILRNGDQLSGAKASSPTTWGYWAAVSDTDVDTGVAWLSPTEYVVGYGHSVQSESNVPSYSLKLFRVGCEYGGSHVLWSGSSLDAGVSGAAWRMLSPDPAHVLVLGRKAGAIGLKGKGSTPWLSIDVRTGGVARTQAMWSPVGAWAVVQKAVAAPSSPSSCSGVHWTWP